LKSVSLDQLIKVLFLGVDKNKFIVNES
jgi:hypothetical protein